MSRLHRLAQYPAVRALLSPALAVRRAALSARHRAGQKRLDRLRRLLVADPVVRLDPFEGDFALSPHSDLFERVALEGTYEPELARLCVAHLDPSRDAVDVGANVGFFTVLMARHLPDRRVLAVEPTPSARARLTANLERNGLGPTVVTYAGALAEAPGRRELSVVDGREEYASFGGLVHRSVASAGATQIAVDVTTLDALVAEHGLRPGFIKIDVEGAELSVLRGAVETLRVHRPVLLTELSPALLRAQGASADDVLDLLRGLGYALTDPLAPGARVGRRAYGDLLAVPSP